MPELWQNPIVFSCPVLFERKQLPQVVYIRTTNAFLRWAHIEGHLPHLLKLPQVKEERKILPTLTPQHIQLLQRSPHRRLRSLALLALDTSLRVDELLSLRREDVDLDTCTLRVRGKGGRHREVPISTEGRKVLHWHLKHAQAGQGLVFCTNGAPGSLSGTSSVTSNPSASPSTSRDLDAP